MKKANNLLNRINKFLIGVRKYKKTYYGWPYLMAFILILFVEVLIALDYYSMFTRAYVGDVLAVVAVYCLIRSFVACRSPRLALLVLGMAVMVELFQLIGLVQWLGLEDGGFWAILLGNTFDWKDLVCYLVGYMITRVILDAEIKTIGPWWERCLEWVRSSVR